MEEEPKQIWIISDDKPGHVNQSRGLAEAICRQNSKLNWTIIPALSWWQAISLACKQRTKKQSPQLIIAAGHKTHLCLLIIGKLSNVPTIVLMKPSLPLNWFDLCIIPEHDSPPNRANVISSVGALNRLQVGKKSKDSAIILIGGPSKHFGWDDSILFNQIKKIISQTPYKWVITTSRRTPDEMLVLLSSLENITIIPSNETSSDWLPAELAKTEYCWVTQDSVSMIYEALTAGCKVHLIDLPDPKNNRITQNINHLRATGYFDSAHSSEHIHILAEADRCATLVQRRFFK